MPTPGQGAIAALDYNDDERRCARAIFSTLPWGEIEFFIDNLLVRIHLVIEMI